MSLLWYVVHGASYKGPGARNSVRIGRSCISASEHLSPSQSKLGKAGQIWPTVQLMPIKVLCSRITFVAAFLGTCILLLCNISKFSFLFGPIANVTRANICL